VTLLFVFGGGSSTLCRAKLGLGRALGRAEIHPTFGRLRLR